MEARVGVRKKAKLFTHGGSQAVRLPKEFRFDGAEVRIEREGDRVVLSAEPAVASGPALWDEIDAIRGEEQLTYSDQPVIRELAFD
jgi:antitoxin VapB